MPKSRTSKAGSFSGFQELGVSGLTQQGGVISEEWLRSLQGTKGMRVYREMADNDSLIGAILFAVEMLLRNVEWDVEPASDSPDHVEEAEFVKSVMHDMSHTWADFVAEALTMLPYGWAAAEIVYKRRVGPTEPDPSNRSQYDDGRIGWRKLPLRSQDTLDRWEFDESGGVLGWWQTPPNGGQAIFLPSEKQIMFRTSSRKNNPEGRSILRNAYVDWYYKKNISSYEAIGIERDLAGIPLMYVPSEIVGRNANAEDRQTYEELKKIARNIRNDEQSCVILPSVYDEHNNQLLKLELMGTGSRRQFDTSAVIMRKERAIAATVLADFILLGHEKVGSFALSSDKTDLFAVALGAWLKQVSDPVNRYALPRLYNLNAMDARTMATVKPGDIEKADVEKFAAAVGNLVAAGIITPGGEQDENFARSLVGLPEVVPGSPRPTRPDDGQEDDAEGQPGEQDPEDQQPSQE